MEETPNFDRLQRLKATMAAIARLSASASDQEICGDIRESGEDPDELAQQVQDVLERAFKSFNGNWSNRHCGDPASGYLQAPRIADIGLLPSAESFDEVWSCIVTALRGLGIDRIRLYLLSQDEQFLVAVRQYGMGKDFIGQRRWLRDEPYLDILSDGRLHILQHLPGKPAPFENVLQQAGRVQEWFCVLLSWDKKVVAKLSGDCKDSGRPLELVNLRAIESFAPVLANAIIHARLLTNLAFVQRLSAAAISSEVPLTNFMKDVCRAVENIPDVNHSSLLLFNASLSSACITADYPAFWAGKKISLRDFALAKELAASCAPLIITDVPNEWRLGTSLRNLLGKFGIRSLAIVPIVCAGRIAGVLTLEATKGACRFTDADVTLAAIYASQVAVAIEYRRRHNALLRLNEVVEAMLLASDYETLARLIAEEAKELFGARFAVFRRFRKSGCESDSQTVFVSGITIDNWETIEEHESTRSRLFAVLQNRGWVEIGNLRSIQQILPGLEQLPDIVSLQAISLKIRNEIEGLLFLGYSRPDAFSVDQRQRARRFAAFAAVSLRRVETMPKLAGPPARGDDERLREHVSAFYEANKIITTSASSGVTAPEILDHVLRHAVECTKAGKHTLHKTYGTIWSFDGISNTLTLESAYPRPVLRDRPVGYTYAILNEFGSKIGVTGRAGIKKSVQNVPYVPEDPDYIQFDPSTRSELAVPILEGDTLLGILNIECDIDNAFDKIDEDTVAALAGLAAIALDHSRQRLPNVSGVEVGL